MDTATNKLIEKPYLTNGKKTYATADGRIQVSFDAFRLGGKYNRRDAGHWVAEDMLVRDTTKQPIQMPGGKVEYPVKILATATTLKLLIARLAEVTL